MSLSSGNSVSSHSLGLFYRMYTSLRRRKSAPAVVKRQQEDRYHTDVFFHLELVFPGNSKGVVAHILETELV